MRAPAIRQNRRVRLSVEPSTDPADYDFSHDVRVRFVETDAMGIVHHSNYLAYFEEARVAYLRHLGRPYSQWRDDGLEAPVLESFVQYRRPLRFDDVGRIHVRLADVGRATFQMAYLLTVDEGTTPQVRATGVTVHGASRGGRPTRLPDWLREMGTDGLDVR